MASEFPLMIFGLPMAALAMYLRAKPENRKAIAGMMLSAALTSIITGITEPIEFAFIFVAPLLFVVHVALAFVSGLLTSYFDIHLGYTFSASIIDYIVGFFNQKNSWALWLLVGPTIAALYFFSFYFLIDWLNLKTPGRGSAENNDSASSTDPQVSKSSGQSMKATGVLKALGGSQNIIDLDACITRLRLTLKDPKLADKDQLKKLGAAGVMQSGSNLQVIFGVESDLLKEEIKRLMTKCLLFAPLEGEILPMSAIPDATFSEKVLGDGFAINPTSNVVLAPCDATVTHMFPTGHAVALLTSQGLEVLIHVGIDSVKMKGQGFKALVQAGDKVKQGQQLIQFDLEALKAHAASTITPVVITNMDRVIKMNLNPVKNKSQAVLEIELKS